jgi:hypothetical protein
LKISKELGKKEEEEEEEVVVEFEYFLQILKGNILIFVFAKGMLSHWKKKIKGGVCQ